MERYLELSVLIKRRHPEVQAEIDRVYQEPLATLGKRRRPRCTGMATNCAAESKPNWLKYKNPIAPASEARGERGLGSLIITTPGVASAVIRLDPRQATYSIQ